MRVFSVVLFFSFASLYCFAEEVRIKDLANIRGVRSNKLNGYGIIFGLQGTGDSAASMTSKRSVVTMMNKLGIKTTLEDVVPGNFASVLVTAELPPFAKNGDRLDVRLSANSDAKSLAGGTLFLTPLTAGDGQVYAVASGPVVVGQADGAGVKVLTVATVPQGAFVERESQFQLDIQDGLDLNLKEVDFTNNDRIVKAVNQHFHGFFATSKDPATIRVALPDAFVFEPINFISQLEGIRVQVDRKAIVVLNERTGTVVMGENVIINPVSISHGDLSIKVGVSQTQSQAASDGKENRIVKIRGASVGELMESLNNLGVKPQDLVGILQALQAAGALNAELKFM